MKMGKFEARIVSRFKIYNMGAFFDFMYLQNRILPQYIQNNTEISQDLWLKSELNNHAHLLV